MGVAVNQVMSTAGDRRTEGREFMSVREGDALPVHGDFATIAVHGDTKEKLTETVLLVGHLLNYAISETISQPCSQLAS